ncbi:hypothetical protein Tco_0959929 [Tanacetum coccineum]
MSENEDKYHDTILDLEEKLKKNVDLFLKIGQAFQNVQSYMLHLGGNIRVLLNVRDSEETLEDAFKSQQKMNEKMNDPIVVANKQNYSGKQKTMPNVTDAFEQNDVYLDEIERQNDLLKDQLLEASLKHDIELCVLLNHEFVDKSLHDELEQVKKKSLKIQEGLKARINILKKDVQRCEKQIIIMAQQQHAADVHPDEMCPPNKRYDLMDANKKVDLSIREQDSDEYY